MSSDRDAWVAIDTETASQRDTPCQIAAVRYVAGQEADAFSSLIFQPEQAFFFMNTAIHGITPSMVADAPRWPEVWRELTDFIDGLPIVAHNAAFDVGVIRQSCWSCDLGEPSFTYACTLSVARRTWPELGRHSLSWLVDELGLSRSGRAHEAESDARASAQVLLAAMAHWSSDSLADLLVSLHMPLGRISPTSVSPFHMANPKGSDFSPNPNAKPGGALYGRTVAFTGALLIPRAEAMAAVAESGGQPLSGVTRHLDYLVCGFQDMAVLAEGASESRKLQKAHELRLQGYELEIISEDDFFNMLKR